MRNLFKMHFFLSGNPLAVTRQRSSLDPENMNDHPGLFSPALQLNALAAMDIRE